MGRGAICPLVQPLCAGGPCSRLKSSLVAAAWIPGILTWVSVFSSALCSISAPWKWLPSNWQDVNVGTGRRQVISFYVWKLVQHLGHLRSLWRCTTLRHCFIACLRHFDLFAFIFSLYGLRCGGATFSYASSHDLNRVALQRQMERYQDCSMMLRHAPATLVRLSAPYFPPFTPPTLLAGLQVASPMALNWGWLSLGFNPTAEQGFLQLSFKVGRFLHTTVVSCLRVWLLGLTMNQFRWHLSLHPNLWVASGSPWKSVTCSRNNLKNKMCARVESW